MGTAMNQFTLLIGHREDSMPFLITETDSLFNIAWQINGLWFSIEEEKNDSLRNKQDLIAALKRKYNNVEEV